MSDLRYTQHTCSVTCTCPTPCASRTLHRLRVGEQMAVSTIRILLEAIERVVRKHRGTP